MRDVFFSLLHREMTKDEKIYLLFADMGMGIYEKFKESFPNRCLNIGIAEQNMIGIAAGLYNTGYRPFCYTISNFLTQRCLEQIRNDICIPKYPITLIGTSTGFDNGTSGSTHHSIDDIGTIKILPYISIYSPSTKTAVELCFNDIIQNNTPAYIRIGKGSLEYNTETISCNCFVYKSSTSKKLVITYGNTLGYVMKNLENVSATDIDFSVLCINKLKPIDADLIITLCKYYEEITVIEEQFASCGLFNILCQFVVENNLGSDVKLNAVCPKHEYIETIGNSQYFAEYYGILQR